MDTGKESFPYLEVQVQSTTGFQVSRFYTRPFGDTTTHLQCVIGCSLFSSSHFTASFMYEGYCSAPTPVQCAGARAAI